MISRKTHKYAVLARLLGSFIHRLFYVAQSNKYKLKYKIQIQIRYRYEYTLPPLSHTDSMAVYQQMCCWSHIPPGLSVFLSAYFSVSMIVFNSCLFLYFHMCNNTAVIYTKFRLLRSWPRPLLALVCLFICLSESRLFTNWSWPNQRHLALAPGFTVSLFPYLARAAASCFFTN